MPRPLRVQRPPWIDALHDLRHNAVGSPTRAIRCALDPSFPHGRIKSVGREGSTRLWIDIKRRRVPGRMAVLRVVREIRFNRQVGGVGYALRLEARTARASASAKAAVQVAPRPWIQNRPSRSSPTSSLERAYRSATEMAPAGPQRRLASAIAASAESAAALVDIAHASAMKATLIIFGLATSVPLIVVGSAILMALLERYRVLVWGGGALLGWIAGDVMAADSALDLWLSEPALHELHIWGGPVGGIIVIVAGYILVGKHRRLMLDEILAGIALLIWIVVDRVSDSLFGGANPDLVRIWSVRGAVFAVMVVAYAIARSQWHIEQEKV